MTGKEFIEDRINTGSRFLVNLHEDSREQVALLLEQYAALRIHDVVGRSEQFVCSINKCYSDCNFHSEYKNGCYGCNHFERIN